MVDIATLVTKVDTTDVKRGRDELGRFVSQAGKTDTANAKLERSFSGVTGSARGLQTALVGLAGVLSAREVVQYSDTWTGLQNQLRDVTATTADLTRVTGLLDRTAEQTRSSLEATTQLYARLSRASTELGLSEQRLIDITGTINQAFALSGATANEAQNAIVQLSQGLASGALRGDEFNSVAEQAPEILRAIATEANLSIGELREFAATGGITADLVVRSLENAADTIEQRFGQSVATFAQQTQQANDNLLEFIGTNRDVKAAADLVGESLITLSENLDTVVDGAQTVGLLTAAYVGVNGAIRTATAAQIAFNVASAGNPIGLILKGLAIAGTAFGTYVLASDAAAGANARLETAVDGSTGALNDQAEALNLTTEAGINTAIAGLESQIAALEASEAGIANQIALLQTQRDQYATTEQAVLSYNIAISELQSSFSQTENESKGLSDRVAELRARLAALKTPTKAAEVDQKALNRIMRDGQAVFDATRTAEEAFAIETARLGQLLQAGAIDVDTYNRAIAAAAQAVNDFNEAQRRAELDRVTDQLDDQAQSAARLTAQYDQLGQAIAQAVVNGRGLEGVGTQALGRFASGTLAGVASGGGVGDILGQGIQSVFSSSLTSGLTSALPAVYESVGLGQLSAAFGNVAADVALSSFGQALGLSTVAGLGSAATTGAALATTYGLTTGVAGGTAAAATATTAGGSLIGGAAAFGPALLLAAPLLAGLFGGDPTDATQSVDVNLFDDSFEQGGMVGEKFSQQNRDTADALAASAAATVAAIELASEEEIDGIFRASVGSRDGIRISFSELSDGLISTAEKNRKKIEEAGGIAIRTDSPIKALEKFAEQLSERVDLDLTIFEELEDKNEQLAQTIFRVEGQVDLLDGAVELLGFQFDAAGDSARRFADDFAEQIGGLDNARSVLDAYYQTFFTDEERRVNALESAQDQLRALNEELGLFGAAAIDTRTEARAYIESLDLTTQAGRDAAAAALLLQGAIVGVEDSARATANTAFGQLAAAIELERTAVTSAIDDQFEALKDNINDLTGVARLLDRAVSGARLQSLEFDRNARRRASGQLQAALSAARGGDFTLAGELDPALRELARPSAGLFESFEDYAFDFARFKNDAQELNDLTGEALTVEERQLMELEAAAAAEQERLDAILSNAQDQLNAINGVELAVLTLAQAQGAFDAAIAGAGSSGVGGGAPVGDGGQTLSSEDYIRNLYVTGLGREPDADGLAAWTSALDNNTFGGTAALKDAFFDTAESDPLETVERFERGGVFGGGLRMVGERGPELEVTGPSRIINNSDTSRLMSALGGGSGSDMSQVEALLRQLVRQTRILDDADGGTVLRVQAVT